MAQPDDSGLSGVLGDAQSTGDLGLILQQLKIMTLLLREGFSLNAPRDEDLALLGQTAPTLSPPLIPNPNFVTPL